MSGERRIRRVAVIGTGVIGRSWALVFLRAGCETTVFDLSAEQTDRAAEWIRQQPVRVSGSLRTAASLDEALSGAEYVQESGFERLPLKQSIFVDLDARADPQVILASSTSAFDMTEIARDVRHPERCVVAHPVNPPHTIPVVEVLGGARTAPEVVQRTVGFLTEVGQVPVLLKKHVHGFLLNRLQFALVREAMHLLQNDVADVDAIDAVVRDGLGLRWALMGPFAVADTNKDEGAREYFGGYEQWITDLMNQLGPTPRIDAALIERLGTELDQMRGATPRAEMRAWRDRMVMEIRRLKTANALHVEQEEAR